MKQKNKLITSQASASHQQLVVGLQTCPAHQSKFCKVMTIGTLHPKLPSSESLRLVFSETLPLSTFFFTLLCSDQIWCQQMLPSGSQLQGFTTSPAVNFLTFLSQQETQARYYYAGLPVTIISVCQAQHQGMRGSRRSEGTVTLLPKRVWSCRNSCLRLQFEIHLNCH